MNKESDDRHDMNNDITPDQRRSLVLKWIEGLEYLNDLLHTTESKSAIENTLYDIEDRTGLGVPIRSPRGEWGLRYLDVPEGGFALVPLTQSDAQFHPYFASVMKGPVYQEGPRAVFLPPDELSPVWRGFILMHEVNHAMRHQDQIYRGKKLDHWVEEYEVYVEEIELVREVYKKSYAKAINDLSQDFEDQLKEGALRLDVSRQVPNAFIEDLFGKPGSALEKNMQRGVVIFDALYEALDRLHPDGGRREHYAMTKWFVTSVLDKNKV